MNIKFGQQRHKAFSLVEISVVIVIIGILLVGISKSIDLYQDFKILNAKKITQNSIVPRINNLALWLETTSESSFSTTNIKENDPIIEWRDINPRNFEKTFFSAVEAFRRPIYKRSGINGIPAIYFDGADDVLYRKFDKFLDSDYTIFIVFNHTGDTGDRRDLLTIMNFDNVANYNIGGLIVEIFPSLVLRIFHRNNYTGAGNDYTTASPVVNFNNEYLLKLVRNYSVTQKINVSLNNNVTHSNLTANVAGLKPDHHVNIGSLYNIGARSFKGFIAEIIVYDRVLLDSEISKVEDYLKMKYRIKY